MVLSKRNFLLDADFLKRLDNEKQRETFAKIIALDWDENPLEEITGRVTGGSASIDGASAVRRTCSLTMVAEELNIHDYYWGLSTKFKLFVGLKNSIDDRYDDICWFPLGTYVISSFSTAQSTNNYTVNIQGKDKMCLLNGELGGTVNSLTWDFGTYDQIEADGTIVNKDYLLKDIIVEAVHEFGREPYHNIIVNDLDTFGVELMEYRGREPMYMLSNQSTLEVAQMTLDGSATYKYYKRQKSDTWIRQNIRLDEIEKIVNNETVGYDGLKDPAYDTGTDRLSVETNFILVSDSDDGTSPIYSVIKAEYGSVVGYRIADLTYAGDLIAQVGNPITTGVLDRIKSMLGEFEYFYDIDGRFIFQKKKTYISSSFNGMNENDEGEQWFSNVAETSAVTYFFEDAQIITAFNNQPQLANLKNDFSVWGVRKSVSGNEIPVHMRYAIDHKPVYYKNYNGVIYTTDASIIEKEKEIMKNDILNDLNNRLMNYKQQYGVASAKLQVPTKREDGSWTPGWWDIRDWYEYYYVLKGEYPNGTMKWYSHNSPEGCVTISSIPGYENHNVTWATHCWLIIVNGRTGQFAFGHGSGDPNSGYKRNCRYYESVLNSDGSITTTPTDIYKEFIEPYSGCSDNHTFLEFLKGDIETNGNLVYFYNPMFPDAVSYDQVVQDQVDKEYQDMIDKGLIQQVGDWREIIYQMAKDNMSYGHKDNFDSRIAENNPDHYPTGQTGYEQYYTDMISFWRQIYNPDYFSNFKQTFLTLSKFNANPTNYWIAERCTENTPYQSGLHWLKKVGVDQSTYDTVDVTELMWNTKLTKKERTYYYILRQCVAGETFQSKADYFIEETDSFETANTSIKGWAKEVSTYPEMLNFWFDFLDAREGDLDKYSVPNVGIRPKAENDTNVKAIYFRDTPNVIFVDSTKIKNAQREKLITQYGSEQEWLLSIKNNLTDAEKEAQGENLELYISNLQEAELRAAVDQEIENQRLEMSGYTFIRLPTYMENMFSISAQGKSAFDKLDNWLYTYACCTESISVTSLPVYYLQPNTRIFVRDSNSGIEGEYIVSRISLPLTYNGTMSISATKAVQRLY